ncbi:hypothetical protein PoB_004695700 [Plakobranchus ocellatus]|uniref:Secreted protein n=1 Tax=Plakobranchus ocellatus TaxID=259542 RepID=A0AAV4BM92_9GAST|nr:hypothetical protein PoB_004695700 [Plakobranchus ocellatus]
MGFLVVRIRVIALEICSRAVIPSFVAHVRRGQGQPVHNKLISDFQTLCQASASVAGLEPATEGSLRSQGRTRYATEQPTSPGIPGPERMTDCLLFKVILRLTN